MRISLQQQALGVILLLHPGVTKAKAFQINLPFKQQQRQQQQQQQRQQQPAASISDEDFKKSSSSSSSSSVSLDTASKSTRKEKNDDSKVAAFANAFFRGVTFPFPILRRIADKASSTGESAEKKEHRVGFSLSECLLAIGCYLAVGVAAYSSTLIHEKPWSLVDALYFSVVTFTTVGYGDICPTTLAGKIFTIFFGLFGISILGVAIAEIGSSLMETEAEMMQAAQEASRRQLMEFWDPSYGDHDTTKSKIKNANSTALPVVKDGIKSTSWITLILKILRNSFPPVTVLIAGGLFMGSIEGWSWTDSIYYAFITAGTLGYGDFSPATERGRLWAVIFIPIAVGAAGEVLGGVASWMMQRRQERFYKLQLERELNLDRLLEMDADKNQKVSREEYVEFMLKEMQLVDESVFKELHGQFKKLDADGGGYLDKHDLRLMALKRQKEKEKLEQQEKEKLEE